MILDFHRKWPTGATEVGRRHALPKKVQAL
jgi:hypothetical protein